MTQNTLKEIGMLYAKKQPQQVEYLTEKSPVLDTLRFEPASHGFWNAYEEVTDITGPALVNMDAPLPSIDVSTDLKKIDLDLFGGIIERGEDAVSVFGGFGNYVARKEPGIMKKFGMAAEQRILYKYIRQFAIDNGVANSNLLYKGTNANANTGYSILALRMESGVTCGLYNPNGFGQGAMMNFSPINGGTLYRDPNGVLVYGGRWKSNMGFQIGSPKTVGAMVNIDLTPTSGDFGTTKISTTLSKIEDMLSDIRATPEDTILIMHHRVRNGINNAKSDKLTLYSGDKNYNRVVEAFNDIPIVRSYNMLQGSEALVA